MTIVPIPLLYQFPTWLQHLYAGVTWRVEPSSKVVYLTFDDGPIPECTPQVLDILAHYQAYATFFMVADNAAHHPDLVARVRQEGHTIGNHTYHHLKGYAVATQTYLRNVQYADQVLHSMLFRPPYGRMRYAEKKALQRAGYRICLWDVLTHDYNDAYSPNDMLAIVKHYTRNGSIINFHDSIKTKDRLLPALPHIIQWLQSQGYQCLAIPEPQRLS